MDGNMDSKEEGCWYGEQAGSRQGDVTNCKKSSQQHQYLLLLVHQRQNKAKEFTHRHLKNRKDELTPTL